MKIVPNLFFMSCKWNSAKTCITAPLLLTADVAVPLLSSRDPAPWSVTGCFVMGHQPALYPTVCCVYTWGCFPPGADPLP